MSATTKERVRAIVLAAGQGKRMKSSLPKVLHEVLGKAILTRVLDALDVLNLEHIHIVVGHGAVEVTKFLQAHPPQTPWSAHLQEPQLGTGHAVQQVAPELVHFKGALLVTVADTPLLTSESLRALVEEHGRAGSAVTMLTTVVPDAKSYGRIVRDASGKIAKIVEDKDASDEEKLICEINPAIYCFAWPAIQPGLNGLTSNNRQNEYYLTDLIAWSAEQGSPVSGVIAPDWHEVSGVNSRVDLAEVTGLLRDRVVRQLQLEHGVTVEDPSSTWVAPEVVAGADTVIRPGCYLAGHIEIGSQCVIGPHTVMHGPVKVGDRTSVLQSLIINSAIGSDCRVGPFSHLRDGAHIAEHVRVGNFVELKKASVGASTNVSHLSYIGDARIGAEANIGAGTITANYDHITKTKSQTVIEDGASTGSNCVLVAPVVIGKESSVAASTVVTRDVPPGALAVGRARQENKEGWAQNKRRRQEATSAVSARARAETPDSTRGRT